MQIDGYSLDAQKSRMKAYAEFNDYEIVGEYEDAGKSGKSIEGRVEFNRMMEDIKSGKDGVSYVLVFKLSRFGRNAADVLSTLQVMQDFGVNLICVEDGIDSSKDAGKLMISVLSAVAEIERENIRVQTMEGRIQKAREGKWNGGFAPYGYRLEKGQLFINEEEAAAIRVIFDQYVHTDTGANGLAKYLATHGIHKIQRQNGKNPLFDAALIRRILKNPVYCGKIAYGRRRTEKVHGTRNDYRLVEQDDYLLVDGLHEGIVSEELWHEAQVKLLAQAEKYEHVNRGKDTKIHLLSGIVKCPVCGVGMYGNKSIKHKADGSKYKDFYYYGCKHRTMTHGHKCDFKKQINEELLDSAVAEVITDRVGDKFRHMGGEEGYHRVVAFDVREGTPLDRLVPYGDKIETGAVQDFHLFLKIAPRQFLFLPCLALVLLRKQVLLCLRSRCALVQYGEVNQAHRSACLGSGLVDSRAVFQFYRAGVERSGHYVRGFGVDSGGGGAGRALTEVLRYGGLRVPTLRTDDAVLAFHILHKEHIVRVVDIGGCRAGFLPYARMDGGQFVQLRLRGQLPLRFRGYLTLVRQHIDEVPLLVGYQGEVSPIDSRGGASEVVGRQRRPLGNG